MGFGFHVPLILAILLAAAVVILVILIRSSRKTINPQIGEPLEMLRIRYARGEISAEEYREKKAVIENERYPGQAVLILMKRYVNGEISREEYEKIKKEVS
jgi:uncharacterized membrane protein